MLITNEKRAAGQGRKSYLSYMSILLGILIFFLLATMIINFIVLFRSSRFEKSQERSESVLKEHVSHSIDSIISSMTNIIYYQPTKKY